MATGRANGRAGISWRRSALAPLLMAATLAPARDVRAQAPDPKPAGQPASASPGASCSARCVAPTSALDTVARALVAAMAVVPRDAEVVTTALSADVDAPRGQELLGRLAAVVAGQLGPGATHRASPTTLAEARRATKRSALVVLSPQVRGGRLLVSADAYPVPKSIWSRARSPQPGPALHAQASAPLDAEVRSFLAPLSMPSTPAVTKLPGIDRDVLALACGDLDGDGASDVVTVTRQRVARWRITPERKATLVTEADWKNLAPVAPVPMRQPLAFATIVEGPTAASRTGHLDVALTDREGSRRLDRDLKVLVKMKGKAVPHGRATACTWIHDLRLGQKLVACDEADGPPAMPDLKWPSDAIASTALVATDGSLTTTVALRRDSALLVRAPQPDGDPKETMVARVGAQIAVADLDQDGAPEVVNALDVGAPALDAIEVRSLTEGKAKLRYRVPVRTGVEAVATCPPDAGDEVAATLVATGGQLWVLR